MSAVSPERTRSASSLPDLLQLRQAWLTIDTRPAAQTYVQRGLGLLLIHAAFLGALLASGRVTLPALAMIATTLAAAAAWPHRRLAILLIASVLFLFLRPFRIAEFTQLLQNLAANPGLAEPLHPMALQVAAVLAFLGLAQIAMRLQRRSTGLLSQRPLMAHMVAFLSLLTVGAFLQPGAIEHTALWAVLAVWASCFWYLAYAAVDQKAKQAQPDAVRGLFMRPVWGGDVAPIGKGLSFLARFEARDETSLAITRLKALKLAVWAAILSWASIWLTWLMHDVLSVPRLSMMILDPGATASIPLAMRWSGLLANYGLDLLVIAAWGHGIVAVVRMMGYGIPRNTVRPLSSRSLAEFWNRYYYYFKEVLVDFFFYPAFRRWFKEHPRLRIAFATFCAAGFGNFLYHLIFASHVFASGAPWAELDRFVTLAFYVSVLSAGLIISQLWGRNTSPKDGIWRHEIWPRIKVALFFCLLKVFDSVWLQGDLGDRFIFFFGLFGVS